MSPAPETLSQGTLLAGGVRYAQPVEGYRTGLEPVLLAACIPARPGQRVLEAGTGAGAGLLCLMTRVPDLVATGVELDPATADLARHNIAANGLTAAIQTATVADAAQWGPVDHAFANPPWHDPAGTPPVNAARARAKHLPPDGLAPWVMGLAGAVGARGTLSLALPAASFTGAAVHLLAAGFGAITLLPLWPRAGVPAKLILVQARRGGDSTRILAGLVLHDADGFTPEAEAILRRGAGLLL